MDMIPGMLAVISGDLLLTLIWLVVWGCILWVLWWVLNTIAPPEPWRKVATVILVLLTVIVLINILLMLVGRPWIRF